MGPRIEFTIKYAEMMARQYPNRQVNRGPTQKEAGDMDQIASVLDNVGYKQGEELHYRIKQGHDTREEYFTECTLYGQFGTEDCPVYVPSTQNHRFVGCLGTPTLNHADHAKSNSVLYYHSTTRRSRWYRRARPCLVLRPTGTQTQVPPVRPDIPAGYFRHLSPRPPSARP